MESARPLCIFVILTNLQLKLHSNFRSLFYVILIFFKKKEIIFKIKIINHKVNGNFFFFYKLKYIYKERSGTQP